MEELLVLFMGVVIPARRAPHGPSFRRPRSARPPQRRAVGGNLLFPSSCERTGKCPALLTSQLVLLCSHRDRKTSAA